MLDLILKMRKVRCHLIVRKVRIYHLCFKKDKVLIGDDEFLLETTSTGHYTLSLSTPKDTKYINHVMHEIFTAESGTGTAGASKKALKLHKRFAHASSATIIKLLNNADMADKEVFKELEKLDAKCDFCLRHRRAAPRPTVSLPLAYEFNELVTMDLKQIDGVWILHCCDYVTRFSSCHVLSSKDSQEVMNAMFKCWITLFGPGCRNYSLTTEESLLMNTGNKCLPPLIYYTKTPHQSLHFKMESVKDTTTSLVT